MDAVLLVEDDMDVMEVTSVLLEDAGYQVLPARNAAQALRLVEQHPDIGAVFTDVNLRDGLNGIELAYELRARGNRASMIIVSGDLGWAETPLKEDMRFLPKPFGRQTLLTVVAEACARTRKQGY
ncbi:response regulator [Dyella sp.]|uniref:response regulator n=1 Tax=Dyella sp. TaxID=1869338 RepID=UPI002ED3B954